MLLIACVVLSRPWLGSTAAASDTKADAELSELVQKAETLLAVAATIAALSKEWPRVPISEHSWRKASMAVTAAAAEADDTWP
jgi:hypothetical protein